MLLYGVTIFSSALLLFLVQPLMGRWILPWFGGSAAVWNACLVFYQVFLLGGYLYAHLSSRVTARRQALLHIGFLGVALTVLLTLFPPGDFWKPDPEGRPSLQILVLLAATIGLPYLAIAASGPLVQHWFGRRFPNKSPYRLYALSNAGSLLGLIIYPSLFEPFTTLRNQALCWSLGYAVFVASCVLCAWRAGKVGAEPPLHATRQPSIDVNASSAPSAWDVALWLALAACGSAFLLATANQLCRDVAAIPFLIIVPLSVYLLTFILCFDNPRWYSRTWCLPALGLALWLAVDVFRAGVQLQPLSLDEVPIVGSVVNLLWSDGVVLSALAQQISVYSLALFIGCMTCHGELVRVRPKARFLTMFYLLVSLGGAIGGVSIALAAPLLFDGYWEYPLCLMALCGLLLLVLLRDKLGSRANLEQEKPHPERLPSAIVAAGALLGMVLVGMVLARRVHNLRIGVVAVARNFYGVVSIVEEYKSDPALHRYAMMYGRIMHGTQFLDPEKRARTTTYFGPNTGIGLALRLHPRRMLGQPLRIGVLGLGAGVIATYAQNGDYLSYYEINPAVVDMAEKYFTYLKDARARGAKVTVLLGDGRLLMERQIEAGNAQRFDVLAMDAFSGDAVPMHLLTDESFQIYQAQLAPDGILAVNISNRFVNLAPVVRELAKKHAKSALFFEQYESNNAQALVPSSWILVTSNRALLEHPEAATNLTPWGPREASLGILWTDDYGSIFSVLR